MKQTRKVERNGSLDPARRKRKNAMGGLAWGSATPRLSTSVEGTVRSAASAEEQRERSRGLPLIAVLARVERPVRAGVVDLAGASRSSSSIDAAGSVETEALEGTEVYERSGSKFTRWELQGVSSEDREAAERYAGSA